MRAVILAAGMGSRLMPLTADRPKCMVRLQGRALLHRQLDILQTYGIKKVLVVGGYRFEALDSLWAKKVRNDDYEQTNMVDSLWEAAAWFDGKEDLIVSYGDIVYNSSVLAALLASPHAFVTVVDRAWRRYWAARMPDPLADAESLKLDTNGRIVDLGRKPQSYEEIEGQYIGLSLIRASVQEAVLEAWRRMDRAATYDGQPFEKMYMTTFLRYMGERVTPLYAAPIENGWIEVDRPEDLAHGEFLKGGAKGLPVDLAYAPLPPCADQKRWDAICRSIEVKKGLWRFYDASWREPLGEASLDEEGKRRIFEGLLACALKRGDFKYLNAALKLADRLDESARIEASDTAARMLEAR